MQNDTRKKSDNHVFQTKALPYTGSLGKATYQQPRLPGKGACRAQATLARYTKTKNN